MPEPFVHLLAEAAAARYRASGQFPWRFARGKLQGDPVFAVLLQRGMVPPQARVLDLGCGKGLLAAWLYTARQMFEGGTWPASWPEPPQLHAYRGLESSGADALVATQALGAHAEIAQGDIRATDFGQADLIVLLDVLHYLDFAAQDAVLARVHAALPPQGSLVLRVGDAAGGLHFWLSTWVDRLVTLLRNQGSSRLHCRTAEAWRAHLTGLGFQVEDIPLRQGATFSNVLFLARREP